MNPNIDNDLEALSKKLYLESPDLWIEFLDKVGEKVIDEMVLFFAIKYNFPSIVKFAIDNKKLILDNPSKNTTYTSIRSHLIATCKQYNCLECIALLSSSTKDSLPIHSDKPTNENLENNISIPTLICENCKSNIFNVGYRVIGESIYKFSNSENKLIEVKNPNPQEVICGNCNKVLPNTTRDKVENICKIQGCNSCGMDLTKVGILDTSKLEFDENNNSFILKSTQYSCGNCNNSIGEKQKDYFNL
ncbi:MAG: hypothetical protein ACRC3Y_05750 [Romboutsia sp.]|uniref:hypothetical protein n=1 Tax=Romboutsia sp. TaxID=1965302 RepID=UPI003F3ECA15